MRLPDEKAQPTGALAVPVALLLAAPTALLKGLEMSAMPSGLTCVDLLKTSAPV